uniref:Cathepsin propeptide inhibitor domain-containing protein n=1 Tax=Leersia perrieri TaxID=77586 RepID=A0A0D9XF84_9ORYZ
MARPSLHLLPLILFSIGAIFAHADLMLDRFDQWMIRHGRAYTDAGEKQRRFEVYRRNVELVEKFNSMSNGYKLADNKFADMTNEEFRAKMLGFRPHVAVPQTLNTCASVDIAMPGEFNDDILPKSVDWRTKGAVVPVKNQGNCGACWAFSAVAAIEGINQIKNGELVSLSEQELVDCDAVAVGCGGGYMSWAFEFVIANHGLATESSYPYLAADGACQAARLSDSAVSIAGYRNVTPPCSEAALARAAAAQPVSVAIDAGSFMFQLYGGGVYTGPCSDDVNHGVVVVGYGEDEAVDGGGGGGGKYWIVRNSWGEEWGEEGYVRMQRDVAGVASGLCGIALLPSYPVM